MNQKKIKIGVVVGSSEIGGAEMDIVRNFPKLNRDRFEVIVINFRSGLMDPLLREQGVRVFGRFATIPPRNIVMRLLTLPSRGLLLAVWIGRILQREQIDIAHFFLPNGYTLGTLACLRQPRAKRVMSRLSSNFYFAEQRSKGLIETQLLHRFVHRAIGNSKPILEDLRQEGIPQEKLRLLYNGIDLTPFTRQADSRAKARQELGIDENAWVMVSVGNLYIRKGYLDLIEACALAHKQLPENWVLLIAGRDVDDNMKRFEALAKEQGLQKHIRFLGKSSNVVPLLFAADLFIHPSHVEGFPNAILEAMSASLPVIACEVGGIPDQVTVDSEEKNSGWLVPPKNPEALSQAIMEAATHPTLLPKMGEQGFMKARDQFSLEKSVGHYESIYLELME